jgi:hypothetical protein
MNTTTQGPTPRYPDVEVQLSGEDGNPFMIIGRVSRALRHAGASREEISRFRDEAMSGDYDHVLRTCMEWIVVA